MKKVIICMIIGMAIIMSSYKPSFAISFSDLSSSHWAYNNIMKLAEDGIINGYENGTYQPERSVSRGEFLKLVMTALYGGEDYFKTNQFQFGHWATPYAIEAAVQGYLMSGTSVDNLNEAITRLEMVNILAKVCIQNNIKRSQEINSIAFSDIENLDESSKLYIDYVTRNALINGYTDGTFKPQKNITRAEIATVMVRFQELAS